MKRAKPVAFMAALGFFLLVSNHVAAQGLRYELDATDSASLDDADVARLALRLLDPTAANAGRSPAERAALVLAGKTGEEATRAYASIGCLPEADPQSSSTCFLRAWAESRTRDVPLVDRLAGLVARLDPVATERLFRMVAWARAS